jgi:ADP-ribose pyrophosphatase
MSESGEAFVPYRVHAQRGLVDTPWFSIRVDEIGYPDGRDGTYYLLSIPPSAVVLPVLEDGRIVLIRQWRYTLQRDHLELPAGRMHAGETPLEAARRELREETGYTARSFEPQPMFHPLMGLSPHEAWPFVARGLELGAQELESPEQIRVEAYPPDEVRDLIRRGEITDVFALVPLLRYLCLDTSAGSDTAARESL